jgi:hypothetical protein
LGAQVEDVVYPHLAGQHTALDHGCRELAGQVEFVVDEVSIRLYYDALAGPAEVQHLEGPSGSPPSARGARHQILPAQTTVAFEVSLDLYRIEVGDGGE